MIDCKRRSPPVRTVCEGCWRAVCAVRLELVGWLWLCERCAAKRDHEPVRPWRFRRLDRSEKRGAER